MRAWIVVLMMAGMLATSHGAVAARATDSEVVRIKDCLLYTSDAADE